MKTDKILKFGDLTLLNIEEDYEFGFDYGYLCEDTIYVRLCMEDNFVDNVVIPVDVLRMILNISKIFNEGELRIKNCIIKYSHSEYYINGPLTEISFNYLNLINLIKYIDKDI